MVSGLTLTLLLSAEGKITVIGPLENKMVCYAMLELARDEIRDFQKPLVETPALSDVLTFSRT